MSGSRDGRVRLIEKTTNVVNRGCVPRAGLPLHIVTTSMPMLTDYVLGLQIWTP